MATMTRSEAKAAFNHVLDKVIERDDSSDLKIALVNDGIENIFDLLRLDQHTIDNLGYQDPDDDDRFILLKKGDRNILKSFMEFKMDLDAKGVPIDFLSLTRAEFDQFRIRPIRQASSAAAMSPPLLQASQSIPNKPSLSLVEIFKRGIKRDPSLFPTLKDEKYHDVWHRSFATQARAQDVADVLDESYTPTSAEDIALFTEKQKYLYAVLESKVLTDRGKAIVREHEHDFDAQTVYKQLQAHHLKSTKAQIESSTILAYITSARLGDGTWNGTTEGFITHWQNQVRLYEKHVPSTDHFSEGQKRTMLQNAVHSIVELRQVKNNADLLYAKSGTPLSYDECTNLLMAAAASYGEQYKSKKTKCQDHQFTHHVN